MENSVLITSGISDSMFVAKRGLIIYEDGAYGDNQAFVTMHDIRIGANNQPCFSAGRAVSREMLLRLAEDIAPAVSYDYLPPEVLAVGAGWVVWWSTAGVRNMYFDTSRGDPIGKQTIKRHLPALVFAVKDQRLFVFALKKSERPMPESALYFAPFYNLWGSGEVCQGSSRKPVNNGPQSIGEWEKIFFESAFSHPNHDSQNLVRHPKGLAGFWEDMVNMRWKRFPNNCLSDSRITLGKLVVFIKSLG